MNQELSSKLIGNQEIAHTPDWEQKTDQIFADIPNGSESGLLPVHFMKSTFPKIGAKIIESSSGEKKYWGLVMPINSLNKSSWIVRDYWINTPNESKYFLNSDLNTLLSENNISNLHHYDVKIKSQESYPSKVLLKGESGIEFGYPSNQMAQQAKNLQSRVWNVEDPTFLYPADLYHPESGLATRLVATKGNKVIGFLLGFFGEGRQWYGSRSGFHSGIWIESQLMGIENEFRKNGVATQLKFLQRENAIKEGIKVIHWTVDPLQAGNANLNFNALGGVAVRHYRNYYVFRNELNKVSASRIGISWILNSDRVKNYAEGKRRYCNYKELVHSSGTEVVHPVGTGRFQKDIPDFNNWNTESDTLLVEIPTDWNSIQSSNISLAEKWRDQTDSIFSKVLDKSNPLYAITGITKDSESFKNYLVIEKINSKIGI